MAHCMDLDPSGDLEGTEELGKQRDAVPVTAKKDACIQDPEAWTLLEPDAICDGFTKHSIEGTCSNSKADTAPELKIQVPANYQSYRNQGYEYQLRNENL